MIQRSLLCCYEKKSSYHTFLDFQIQHQLNAAPSRKNQTISITRVMRKIETKEFQACFMKWVQSVSKATLGDVVAIDGKTLRRSHNRQDGVPAIHMVSAWSSENGLVLGQEKTAEKSNEITAIPQLLEVLELKGCIITIHAMGCQTAIAVKIIQKKADYIEPNAKKTLTAVRQHWGIENKLHWTLDMTFREDESRIRTEASPENFAIMRHIALNLIKNDTSRNASMKRKRFMAALEDDFRETIIKQVI